jgi:hypothetical protein
LPGGRELLSGEFGVFHLWRIPEHLIRKAPPADTDSTTGDSAILVDPVPAPVR